MVPVIRLTFMRYAMFIVPAVYAIDPEHAMPSAEMVEKMMAYNEELAQAGALLSLDGLHPPAVGARLVFTEDGVELEEVAAEGAVGGYWVIEVDSHEAAVAWASRVPALPGDVVELRRIQEMEDFPEDVQDVVNTFDI
jgi:hypothetical protein